MTIATILAQAAAGGAEGAGESGIWSLLMMVALIAIFYFFMIRPQSKKQKEIRKFRESLEKGSKVVTAGGIHGIIREVKETTFVLEIASNIKITIDKGSVYPSADDSKQDVANANVQK